MCLKEVARSLFWGSRPFAIVHSSSCEFRSWPASSIHIPRDTVMTAQIRRSRHADRGAAGMYCLEAGMGTDSSFDHSPFVPSTTARTL